MTDDRVETHVVDRRRGRRRRARRSTSRSTGCGCTPRAGARRDRRRSAPTDAKPAPGVLEAIAAADVVLLPPTNPVVTIGTILAVPGIREALVGAAGAGRRRLADHRRRAGARHGRQACSPPIGVETTAAAVGAALRRPDAAAARRLAGRHRDADAVPTRRGRRDRLPRGAAADDRRRRDRRDRRAPRSTLAAELAAAGERGRWRSRASAGIPEVAAGRRPRRPARRRAGRRRLRWRRRRRRGDVSKIVSQGRGPRPCGVDREAAIDAETVRVVGRAAGRPGSSRPGTASCWPRPGSTPPTSRRAPCCCCPVDPDASARGAARRAARAARRRRSASSSPTRSGRPWRDGPGRRRDRRRRASPPLDDLRGRDRRVRQRPRR